MLKETLHKPIQRSRYHYLHFRLPEGYRNLMATGSIEHDFSMGYSENIGFRAGICSSFNFYDLAQDYETKLRIHPFAYMDVALKNGLKLLPEQAIEEINKIEDESIRVKLLSTLEKEEIYIELYNKEKEILYKEKFKADSAKYIALA